MVAIIPAAGHGTRFYPAGKSVPKEMLPILGKPAIQWIVEEAIEAGADEVVVVTAPDKPALRKHFTPDPRLLVRLADRPEALASIQHLDAVSAKVRFVDQVEQRGLGHAVLQAEPFVRDQGAPVLILLGDALVHGENCSRELVAHSRERGGASLVGLEQVPREKVSRYGIAAGEATDCDRLWRLTDLVEKPTMEAAPSNLAVAGRYLLDPRVFGFLAEARIGYGGEIQLTDAIRQLLSVAPVFGCRYIGKRHDIGNPMGYLDALLAFAGRG